MDRVNLSVLGLSTSHSQAGAYALILQEDSSSIRVPIIIGANEAQAIAIALEGLEPPRPLTHDLFLNLAFAYDIHLIEAEINRIEEGIFYSKIVFKMKTERISMDARPSDAVALAIRFNAPIYATKELLKKAGIMIDNELEESQVSKKVSKKEVIKSLKDQLQKAISQEDYEEAARIKSELSFLEDL